MKNKILNLTKKYSGLLALIILFAFAVSVTSCEPDWDPDDPYYAPESF